MYYVYVLKDRESGKHYIGYSSNLRKRIEDHKNKLVNSTKHGNYELVYYEAYLSGRYAFKRERQYKSNGRMRKYLMERIECSLCEEE